MKITVDDDYLSPNEPLSVYFSANYTHVPNGDLEKVKKNIEFIKDKQEEKVKKLIKKKNHGIIHHILTIGI